MCRTFGTIPQLTPLDWKNLYPIICFDVSAQKDDLKSNGIQIQLHVEIEGTYDKLKCYALTLEDTQHYIQIIDGKMVRIE